MSNTFNFNNVSTTGNSLEFFSGDGTFPRIGLNFGNSISRRGISSLKKSSNPNTKGHPGTGGQSVGQGVEPSRNFFRSILNSFNPSLKSIDQKKWNYGSDPNRKHPAGFTPPWAFLKTKDGDDSNKWQPFKQFGVKQEYEITIGNLPYTDPNSDPYTIPKRLKERQDLVDKIDSRTKNFTFGLNKNIEELTIKEKFDRISDNGFETYAGLQTPKDKLPLSSFTNTILDNEDPTILGFDIEIDEVTSPLFNGAVDNFINKYGNNQEIGGRDGIYSEFITQFKKFFKTNTTQEGNDVVKNYYITKLTGLDKVGHVKSAGTSGDSGENLFTNFPADKIEISIKEDVEQNISYLAYLYNLLSRSRIEGKRIIPKNLLRFNLRIIVTEIRNYNRVVKVGSDFRVLNDLISKKEYNFYECEFFFNNLTHGSSIEIGGASLTTVGDYSLSFNYKFVSSEFHKFVFNPKTQDFEPTIYNDELFDPTLITSLDTNRAIINTPPDELETRDKSLSLSGFSSISFLNSPVKSTLIDTYPKIGTGTSSASDDVLGRLKKATNKNEYLKNLGRNLVRDISRAGADAINREIGKRFALVNKAINERLNRLGLSISLNTIQNPRNIYNPGNQLGNDLSNAIRGFVGRSVGRFFSSPVNTSEANNGYLPQRQGGPFRSSSIYRPTATTSISRISSTQIRGPRNIYVRRDFGPSVNFLGSQQINNSNTSGSRTNPFVLGITRT